MCIIFFLELISIPLPPQNFIPICFYTCKCKKAPFIFLCIKIRYLIEIKNVLIACDQNDLNILQILIVVPFQK